MGTAGWEDVSPSLWIQSCYTHMLFHPCNHPGEVARQLLLDSSLGKTNQWEDRIICIIPNLVLKFSCFARKSDYFFPVGPDSATHSWIAQHYRLDIKHRKVPIAMFKQRPTNRK